MGTTDPALRVAARVARRVLGRRPRDITPLGGGLSNRVFRIRVRGADWVLRMHDQPDRLGAYQRERWAMEQAAACGVPTARVVDVGMEAGWPYFLQEQVEGIPGSLWSEPAAVLRQLGALAARVHRIRTRGFGAPDGLDGGRAPQARWGDYLRDDLNLDARLAILQRADILTPRARTEMDAVLRTMRAWRRTPTLNHGDLRLKNVIVSPDDGRVLALLDWEDCVSAPPPFWDLAIALHDLGPDEKEALLEGYGLTPRGFERVAGVLRVLNLLNYAWVMHEARAAGERQRVAWLHARSRGAFDISPG